MDKVLAQKHFAKAEQLYAQGDFRDCLDILDEVNSAFPLKKSVMLSRARCHYKLDHLGQSLHICEQILERYKYPLAESLMRKIVERFAGSAPSDSGAGGIEFSLSDSGSFPPSDTPSEPVTC